MSDYEETRERLTKEGCSFRVIPNSGGISLIVEDRAGERPAGMQIEDFYSWGYAFAPDGDLYHSWMGPKQGAEE